MLSAPPEHATNIVDNSARAMTARTAAWMRSVRRFADCGWYGMWLIFGEVTLVPTAGFEPAT